MIGAVAIHGRADNTYLLHFEEQEEVSIFLEKASWSMDGAFPVVEEWRPNIVLPRFHIFVTAVWVQICELHLEYHFPNALIRLGQLIGDVIGVNCEDVLPANVR